MQFRSRKVPLGTMLTNKSCSRHREKRLSILIYVNECCVGSDEHSVNRNMAGEMAWRTDREKGTPSNPSAAFWLDGNHGVVGFYMTQTLSGHGCFNTYLKCVKKRDDESCRYCGSPVDDAEHILFICTSWGVAEEVVRRAVCAEFTPDTMVPPMLQSKDVWKNIESLITLMMGTKDLDGRRERSNGEGQ